MLKIVISGKHGNRPRAVSQHTQPPQLSTRVRAPEMREKARGREAEAGWKEAADAKAAVLRAKGRP